MFPTINWIKIGAALAIVIAVGGTIFGVYEYIKYKDSEIAAKQAEVDKAKSDLAISESNNKILKGENDAVKEENKNVKAEIALNNALNAFVNKKDKDIQVDLNKNVNKLERIDFDAIRKSKHREMLLDSINNYFSYAPSRVRSSGRSTSGGNSGSNQNEIPDLTDDQ